MFGYLIILFTVLPALELMILIKVGGIIGLGNTFFIIIFTGVLGAYLARLQGFLILSKIQENLNRGLVPSEELLDGLMILVGGIVLLTPGFVTDSIGFLLLIPWTRSLLKLVMKKKFEKMIRRGQAIKIDPFKRNDDGYTNIDIN